MNKKLIIIVVLCMYVFLSSCSKDTNISFDFEEMVNDFQFVNESNQHLDLSSSKAILLKLTNEEKASFLKKNFGFEVNALDKDDSFNSSFVLIYNEKKNLVVHDFYINDIDEIMLSKLNDISESLHYDDVNKHQYKHKVSIYDTEIENDSMTFETLVIKEEREDEYLDLIVHSKVFANAKDINFDVKHESKTGSLLRKVGTPEHAGESEYILTLAGHLMDYEIERVIKFDGSYTRDASTQFNEWHFELDLIEKHQPLEVISVFEVPTAKVSKIIEGSYKVNDKAFKYEYR